MRVATGSVPLQIQEEGLPRERQHHLQALLLQCWPLLWCHHRISGLVLVTLDPVHLLVCFCGFLLCDI